MLVRKMHSRVLRQDDESWHWFWLTIMDLWLYVCGTVNWPLAMTMRPVR